MRLQPEPVAAQGDAALPRAMTANFAEIDGTQKVAPVKRRRGHMFGRLKYYLFRRRALAQQGVIMDLTAYCDRETKFEGHNRVVAGAKLIESSLGLASYVGARSLLTNTLVGRFTCIGPAVETIIGAHPTSEFASIHPAFFSTKRQAGFTFVTSDLFPEFGTKSYGGGYLIDIGSDVWIGHGARIMQGVRIGHGAVVAAGSLVTKDVPPYVIVAGIPARPLKQRFPDSTIKRLLATSWWNLDFETINRLAPNFSHPDLLLQELEKFPAIHP